MARFFHSWRRNNANAASATSISGVEARLAIIPKAIIGATRPTARAVLPARFSGGPSERIMVLRIRKENRASRIIGSSGGAFTPADIPPVSKAAGKNRPPSSASVRELLTCLEVLVTRKFAGIFRAARTKERTRMKLDSIMPGPAQ